MRTHELVRFDKGSGDGTFGRFEQWVTAEDDWLDNRPFVSCIAPGEYVCKRVTSPKFGETFEVTGVPGRSLIRFHPMNTEEDVEGCIGVGISLGTMKRMDEDLNVMRWKISIKNSRQAFKEFMDFFEGVDEWLLVVKDYEP